MNILIIEDERKAAAELKRLLEDLRPDIVVAGILPSVDESLCWLENNPVPDLIFSDIQLADGLSFEIYTQLKLNVPVVFCTAFDEYAIKAFDANGIDYLLKPIEKNKLEKSLGRYDELKKFFAKGALYDEKLQQVAGQLMKKYPSTILIHHKDKIIPLKINDIMYVRYENGITYICTNHQQYYTGYTLDEMESKLDPSLFFRANRQYILHRASVQDAEHYFARKLIVKLHLPTPDPVVVSKGKASAFLSWLSL